MLRRISPLQRRNLPWIYLFLLPTVVLFFMFYFIPIVTVFITSFTRWNGYTSPEFNGITNYLRLFRQGNFIISLKNLALWSLIAMTLHVGFGVLISFLLFEKPHGWKFVRAVFMIPNVISAAAWAMIYKFIFMDDFGLLNNFIRLFAPNFHVNWFFQSPAAFWAITFTWLFYAVIVTLVVLADLMAIPQEVKEAARIDGASRAQITFRINLPLCRNSIGTSVILAITSRISMYENIMLTTRGGPGDDTMNLALILVKNVTDMNYGLANTTAVVMFVIGILTLLLVNRLFRMNDPVY